MENMLQKQRYTVYFFLILYAEYFLKEMSLSWEKVTFR